MSTKIKLDDLKVFDMAEHLTDEESIAWYLDVVTAEGEAGELADALEIVARARILMRRPPS